MNNLNLYLIILFVASCEALAQSTIYYSNVSKNNIYLMLGIILYIFVAFAIYQAYNYKGVGMVNAIWSAISIILLIMIGLFIFNENISTQEYVGIIFIILGIVLTNRFTKFT